MAKISNLVVTGIVRDLVEEAIGRWQGVDWEDPEGRHDEASVEADADRADELGRKALAALDLGDYAAAADALKEAYRLESAYGDAPVWGAVAGMATDLAALSDDPSPRHIANPWTGVQLDRPWTWRDVETRVAYTTHPADIPARLAELLEAWVDHDERTLGCFLLS